VGPLEGIEIAVVYRGTARAAEEVEELAQARRLTSSFRRRRLFSKHDEMPRRAPRCSKSSVAQTAAEVAELAGARSTTPGFSSTVRESHAQRLP
jgi:hypothetical protein